MKNGIFLALEDDTDLNLDTDKTIESDAADPSDDNADDPLVTDGNIVIPDTDTLAVNKVSDKEKELKQIINSNETNMDSSALAQTDRQVAVDDALNVSADLTAAVESFIHSVNSRNYIDPTAANFANIILQSSRKRVGLEAFTKVSMEDFSSITRKENASKIVLEGFVDTIKSIWRAIINAIMRAIDWVKHFVKDFFFSVDRDIKTLQTYVDAIINNRNKNADKLPADASKILDAKDRDHYVASPELHLRLNIDGKTTVPDYAVESERILHLSQSYRVLINEFNGGFSEKFKETAVMLLTKDMRTDDSASQAKDRSGLIVNIPGSNLVDNKLLVPVTNKIFMLDNDTDGDRLAKESKTHGILGIGEMSFRNKKIDNPDYTYLITAPYLGNFIVAYKLPKFLQSIKVHGEMLSIKEALGAYANWEIETDTKLMTNVSDGWLRWLSNGELKESTVNFTNALNELKSFSDSSDKFEGMLKKLKDVIEHCEKLIENTGDSAKDKSSVNFSRAADVNLIVGAVNGVLKVGNSTIHTYGKYIRTTASAWGLYLKEIYKHELKIIGQ